MVVLDHRRDNLLLLEVGEELETCVTYRRLMSIVQRLLRDYGRRVLARSDDDRGPTLRRIVVGESSRRVCLQKRNFLKGLNLERNKFWPKIHNIFRAPSFRTLSIIQRHEYAKKAEKEKDFKIDLRSFRPVRSLWPSKFLLYFCPSVRGEKERISIFQVSISLQPKLFRWHFFALHLLYVTLFLSLFIA